MRNIVFSVFVLLVSGCTSVPKNTENYAMLQNSNIQLADGSHSLMFESVNDKKLEVGAFTKPNQAAHYVSAGNVKLNAIVTYRTDKYRGVQVADYAIDVSLEKSIEYFMEASELNGCITMSFKNTKGELIAGPLTKPWYEYSSPERMLIRIGREEIIKRPKLCPES